MANINGLSELMEHVNKLESLDPLDPRYCQTYFGDIYRDVESSTDKLRDLVNRLEKVTSNMEPIIALEKDAKTLQELVKIVRHTVELKENSKITLGKFTCTIEVGEDKEVKNVTFKGRGHGESTLELAKNIVFDDDRTRTTPVTSLLFNQMWKGRVNKK